MTVPETPDGSVDDLAQVASFLAEQRHLNELPVGELSKVQDLCDDVMGLAAWPEREHVEHPTWLGRRFACFERFAGAGALRHKRRDRRPHAAPSAPQAKPAPCARDFCLFDRLSRIYGGKFRGSVVLNSVLGLAASVVVLFTLSPPLDMQALIDVFHKDILKQHVVPIVEFACLATIGLIYLRGRTPEDDEENKSAQPPVRSWHRWSHRLARWWSHLWARRWHQRWLEYRLLAERFRYVDVLLPLGHVTAPELSIAPKDDVDNLWHQRYYVRRMAKAHPASQSVVDYRNHVLTVMAEQEKYHLDNYALRGAIARRLDGAGRWAYGIALVICFAEIVRDRLCGACAVDDPVHLTLIFAATILPVFSAATYVIRTHAEYAKVADTSRAIFDRIHRLFGRLSELPVSDEPARPSSLATMRPIVVEFAGVVITEATGWRAMLRDKNVPLA